MYDLDEILKLCEAYIFLPLSKKKLVFLIRKIRSGIQSDISLDLNHLHKIELLLLEEEENKKVKQTEMILFRRDLYFRIPH